MAELARLFCHRLRSGGYSNHPCADRTAGIAGERLEPLDRRLGVKGLGEEAHRGILEGRDLELEGERTRDEQDGEIQSHQAQTLQVVQRVPSLTIQI